MPPEQQPLNLIRIFDFYLALMFVISFLRRWDVYLNAIRLLIARPRPVAEAHAAARRAQEPHS